MSSMPKYIFITGGVVSSLGKGIIASSLGLLLSERGYKVTIQKLDPYLNVDPGTMSPYQHGEVFVTEDGAETDLDLGHYERFINRNLYKINNLTAGQIYSTVIDKERKGQYLGGTVQMVPHVSNQIKSKIFDAVYTTESEIIIVEVGGTVGDIESLIFLEAIRQMRTDHGHSNTAYIHSTLIPKLLSTGELKTKPTQHSVELLRSKGITPDMLICRSEETLEESLKDKLALFTGVQTQSVIECLTQSSIYLVPQHLENQGMTDQILQTLNLESRSCNLDKWNNITSQLTQKHKKTINIAIVGKYTQLEDAYISVSESLKHSIAYEQANLSIKWIKSDSITQDNITEIFQNIDGVVIPGGFGERGVEGKISTIQYIREHKIPFLGLCLGMQCAIMEFARNKAGLKNAHSTEFEQDTEYPVIDFLPGQTEDTEKGGTMRLGAYPCALTPNSLASKLYETDTISERHRHRYEVNNKYINNLLDAGLVISGQSPDNQLVEIIELPEDQHPYFIASQFHPEYKSRLTAPHPLFSGLIKAGIKYAESTRV